MLTFKDFKLEAAEAIDALDFEEFQKLVHQIVEEGLEDQESLDVTEEIVEEDVISGLYEKLTKETLTEDIIKIVKIINLVFRYNDAVDPDKNDLLEETDPLKNACSGVFPQFLLSEDNYDAIIFHEEVLGDAYSEEFDNLLSYALESPEEYPDVVEEGVEGAPPPGGDLAAPSSSQEDEEAASDEASLSPSPRTASPSLESPTQRRRT